MPPRIGYLYFLNVIAGVEHIHHGIVQTYEQDCRRHGFPAHAHLGKVFNRLEQDFVYIRDVELELKQVSVVDTICVVYQDGIIVLVIDSVVVEERHLSFAFDFVFLHALHRPLLQKVDFFAFRNYTKGWMNGKPGFVA